METKKLGQELVPVLAGLGGGLTGLWVLEELRRQVAPCPFCELAEKFRLAKPLAFAVGGLAAFALARLALAKLRS